MKIEEILTAGIHREILGVGVVIKRCWKTCLKGLFLRVSDDDYLQLIIYPHLIKRITLTLTPNPNRHIMSKDKPPLNHLQGWSDGCVDH